MDEAKTMRALEHENIVRYIDDFFLDKNTLVPCHVLVMEYCEGKPEVLEKL